MDFKINLPTEECTCDAKQFYDKYRKQVDAFIQNEIEIAKTANVVVGRKAVKSADSDYKETSVSDNEEISSKKIYKRKVHLPKIKGAKHKRTRKGKSKSTSISTVSLETHLPEIKVSKKWSDELSSSSSGITQLIDGSKQKEIESSWQTETGEMQFKKKKKAKDELSSSSSDIMQLLDRSGKQIEPTPQQKEKIKLQLKRKKEAKDVFPSSSSDTQRTAKPSWKKVEGEMLLKKKKKAHDKFSSSSLETVQLLDKSGKQIESTPGQKSSKPRKKETKKLQVKGKKEASEDELSSSSSEEGKKKKTRSLQKKTGEIQFKKKKKAEDELSSSSSETTQLIDEGKKKKTKSLQKKTGEIQLKKKKKAEDEVSSSSFEISKPAKTKLLWQEEIDELQLRKRKKSDFLSSLISKSKKEGLADDLITNMLAKARDSGHEEDLLFYLSNANDDGTLQALLFTMSEVMETGGFEEFITDLINKGKEKRRKSLLLKLINNFRSDQKDHDYMATLITKAIKEEPDDELLLILSKAVEENSLNSLVSNIYKAKKQGQLDDMLSVLLKKGKKEHTKRLLSIVNSKAAENGIDNTIIEDTLAIAKKSGQLDELLAKFNRAKTSGTLDQLLSSLANEETGESSVDILLNYRTKPEEEKPNERDYSDIFLEKMFDDDLIAKWFAKAKTKEEEELLLDKLSKVMKTGKHVEFNTLAKEITIENIDDLFDVFDEVISDDDSDTDVNITASRGKKPKLLRPKLPKPLKKVPKQKKRKSSIVVEDDVEPIESDLPRSHDQNRKLSKLKKQLLFKRLYSISLPDVDYDLIERHRLANVDLTVPEKISDEEEHGDDQKIDRKKSKKYRESFLKKIYGGRTMRPTSSSDSSASTTTSSIVSSKYFVRKRVPKKKPQVSVIEKEQPSPRKVKKNVVTYFKKKPVVLEKEYSDSDISSFEEVLDKKISRMCDISGEDRTERGYLVGFRYKDDDDETIDWTKKKPKKKTSIFSESYNSEDWMSRARRRAILYFDTRKIEDLFHFLGSHLVSDKPEDPISYLIILLEECIQFKNGILKPPLLFEQYHVESLYYSMDIFNEGFISLEQYCTGMETLHIKEFKNQPRTNNNNMVLKETFIHEALRRQEIHLKNLLRGTSYIFKNKENSSLGSVWSKIELYHEG